jgi:alcohol dehydrogenase class IV
MLPKAAIVDPELTYGLPPDVTAFTGMDALTQLIEPFVSVAANPMTDGLCKEGIQRAAQSLQAVYLNGQDTLNRRNMALASLFGGLALANAKLGAVHGFAGPIGGMFSIPHGAICARLLPIVMDVNLRALRERQPSDPIINRYHEIAKLITGNAKAEDVEGVRWIEELSLALQIPPLSEFGFTRESIPVIVDLSAQSSSMKGNPIQLNRDEMVEILERAL